MHAFLRDDAKGWLVLLASGTGFAPIWAIASAAQQSAPDRAVHLICSAKDAGAFYTGAALRKAKQHGRSTVQIVLERQDDGLAGVLPGNPAEHTPPLTGDDIVFAEGGPRMMESARDRAEAAGARFCADLFSPAAPAAPSLSGELKKAMGSLSMSGVRVMLGAHRATGPSR